MPRTIAHIVARIWRRTTCAIALAFTINLQQNYNSSNNNSNKSKCGNRHNFRLLTPRHLAIYYALFTFVRIVPTAPRLRCCLLHIASTAAACTGCGLSCLKCVYKNHHCYCYCTWAQARCTVNVAQTSPHAHSYTYIHTFVCGRVCANTWQSAGRCRRWILGSQCQHLRALQRLLHFLCSCFCCFVYCYTQT